MISRILFGTALLLLAACGGSADAPDGDGVSVAGSRLPASALRLPEDGGRPAAYRLPDLAPADWQPDDELSAASIVGADPDQGAVYALDGRGRLSVLLLEDGRVLTLASGVRRAALGPDGSLFVVDSAGAVSRIFRRITTPYRDTLPAPPEAMFADQNGQLVAAVAGARPGLVLFAPDAASRRIPLPVAGAAAVQWGQFVAVPTDSGIVAWDPHASDSVHTIELRDAPAAVRFSPSGHRIFAVGRERPELYVLDRYGETLLRTIELPGPARDLRNDALGAWLLVRPAAGDSVWIVDPAAGTLVGSVRSGWQADLPAIGPSPVLLHREGRDLVARDLTTAGFPVRGRVARGAGDLWLPLAWTPGGAAPTPPTVAAGPEPGPDEPAAAPDPTDPAALAADSALRELAGPAERVYLQVSSSQNPEWARELAGQLRRAGLPASVLDPARSGEPFRVVLGPYDSRAEAEATSRQLARPSFIISADSAPARREPQ